MNFERKLVSPYLNYTLPLLRSCHFNHYSSACNKSFLYGTFNIVHIYCWVSELNSCVPREAFFTFRCLALESMKFTLSPSLGSLGPLFFQILYCHVLFFLSSHFCFVLFCFRTSMSYKCDCLIFFPID